MSRLYCHNRYEFFCRATSNIISTGVPIRVNPDMNTLDHLYLINNQNFSASILFQS